MVPVRAQSFERTMNHEATKPRSVTVRAGARESKEPSAPGEVPVKALSDGGSIPPTSTKKSLLEPLPKSKALGEDFFHYFLKSGRWGVRVNQHGRFCRNVPGSFSFFGKRGLLLFA